MTHYSKQIAVSNELSSIQKVSDQFTDFCEAEVIDLRIITKVNIVFDEILSNIVKYSNAEAEDNTIKIEFGYRKPELNNRIIDKGVPFNPFHVTPPDFSIPLEERLIGGLGIHLVKNLMDDYRYERINAENIITMSKKI